MMSLLNRSFNALSSTLSHGVASSSLSTLPAAVCGVSRCCSFQRNLATLSPLLTTPLKQSDPQIFDIIEKEKRRQRDSLALIPSENFTSLAVLEALGSIMQNKYSEGYPAARYYGGNEFIDMSETLCQKRALEAFRVSPDRWGVNVQPLSGSPCNFYVYTAVLGPHERMMALDLPHGGHLSHGYATPTKKVSAVSIYFECLPYRLNEQTGLIDYDTLEKNALLYRPKLIVSGASAYPRHIDYGRLRKIADSVNALLMIDMAHISGLIAGGSMPSPFDHADIVTTTTHKSLRGPRGAMIFFRRGERKKDAKGNSIQYDLEDKINQSVFPGHQGGPHNHTITALAVALEQAKSKEFQLYAHAILENNKQLANSLLQRGYKLVSGGTDNHLLLVDLRPKGINGAKVEKICELVNIALNKNTVPGDLSAMNPGGIRIGTPALTSRGLTVADFEKVAEFIHRAVEIALKIQNKGGGATQKMNEFKEALKNTEKDWPELEKLKKEVVEFIQKFPSIGFDEKTMKYKD